MRKSRKLRTLRRNIGFLAIALVSLAFPSCLNSKPKVLGSQKLNLWEGSDGTLSSFKFNFAMQGTTVVAATPFYLQGAANTTSGMQSTCNSLGTGCVCEFLDTNGSVLQTVSSSYDSVGNYFTCTFNDPGGTLGNITDVRIRNTSGSVVSSDLPVTLEANLTIEQLIGTDLDVNRVRSIYRYTCNYNFLQKDGTTTSAFDCSSQATLCDTGDFCLLQAQFPYYLYSDGYATNFHLKIADQLYNANGSGKICSQQIKQIDCTGAGGTPALKFGLYAEQTGIWAQPVGLGAGPDISTTNYGFAAKTNSGGNCPPGLDKRVFWTVTVNTAIITPTHNFTNGLVATEVEKPTVTPTAFEIDLYGQGDCNGTFCTMPISYAGDATPDQAYTAGATTFCVIPDTMLD